LVRDACSNRCARLPCRFRLPAGIARSKTGALPSRRASVAAARDKSAHSASTGSRDAVQSRATPNVSASRMWIMRSRCWARGQTEGLQCANKLICGHQRRLVGRGEFDVRGAGVRDRLAVRVLRRGVWADFPNCSQQLLAPRSMSESDLRKDCAERQKADLLVVVRRASRSCRAFLGRTHWARALDCWIQLPSLHHPVGWQHRIFCLLQHARSS
jgi:hypothetical protein